jgi:hypothetical protein
MMLTENLDRLHPKKGTSSDPQHPFNQQASCRPAQSLFRRTCGKGLRKFTLR